MGLNRPPLRNLSLLTFSLLLGFLNVFAAPASRAQQAPADQQPEHAWARELKKYPGLSEELDHLFAKLREDVHFPAPRKESRLLPLSPNNTLFYMAIPNYGEVAAQTLATFRQELRDSEVLRNWWAHGSVAPNGPKIEGALDKVSQLHQFLGDEITISVTAEAKDPTFLVVSEIRKPGFKPYLEGLVKQASSSAKSDVRILDEQQLALAQERPGSNDLLVLVRPDFVAASTSLVPLRAFAKRQAAGGATFANSPFGQRIRKEYQGGVTVMGAADMQPILEKASPSAQRGKGFRESGFDDMQYIVWGQKQTNDKSVGEMELSFRSPRHGAAAWLAKPRPLGSLDFVSPQSVLSASVVLIDPARIFEDAKALSDPTKPNAFAVIPSMEQNLNISFKDDLLSLLSGEITLEFDSFAPAQPTWRGVLGVKDTAHLQRTLDTILQATHFEHSQEQIDGVTYYSMLAPNGKKQTPVFYAFADGYMVIGGQRDAVAEGIHLHRSGGSLAKSPKFLAALPPGHDARASALFYQDPIALAATQLKSQMPDLAESLKAYAGSASPAVVSFYGEESAIRELSSNRMFDATGVLVVAAIAIPNLLKSKMAANEASAVGSVRSINTAQVAYASTYPQAGFAPNLASLGVNPLAPRSMTKDHAGLLDEKLAGTLCGQGAGCPKSGYLFRVASVCGQGKCSEYVIVATPESGSTGTRSFCSTSEGVIRYKPGAPVSRSLSVLECKSWLPLR
jgi:hypothetical protein